MSSLPYMKFYPGDYLPDTMHLSTEMHGAYLLIIFHYFVNKKSILNDDKLLASITRMSLRKWLKIKPVIASFFCEKEGYLVHTRIERDIEREKKYILSRVEAGRRSAIARKKRAEKTIGYHASSQHHGDDGGSAGGRDQVSDGDDSPQAPLQQSGNEASTGEVAGSPDERGSPVDASLPFRCNEKATCQSQSQSQSQKGLKRLKVLSKDAGAPRCEDVDELAEKDGLDLTGFFSFYSERDWKTGDEVIRDWRGVARAWGDRQRGFLSAPRGGDDDAGSWTDELGGLL